jgi:hypothetical protein
VTSSLAKTVRTHSGSLSLPLIDRRVYVTRAIARFAIQLVNVGAMANRLASRLRSTTGVIKMFYLRETLDN